MACAAGTASQAAVISYNDFSSVSGLTLNGSATQAGDALRLTPAWYGQAGSAFSTAPVSLAGNASFSTRFQFRFGSAGGDCDSATTCGADGLVFVLQTVGNNVGGGGVGIGYAGIGNSVGIEFDSWNNGDIDRGSSNHVGINTGGNIDSLLTAQITEADLNNGDIWNAWIDYDGATHQLDVRATRAAVRPTSALLSLVRDLGAELGTTQAYIGFTSGTGSAFANHDVLAWTLENRYAPIDGNGGAASVPEPGALALTALALAAAADASRRRLAQSGPAASDFIDQVPTQKE